VHACIQGSRSLPLYPHTILPFVEVPLGPTQPSLIKAFAVGSGKRMEGKRAGERLTSSFLCGPSTMNLPASASVAPTKKRNETPRPVEEGTAPSVTRCRPIVVIPSPELSWTSKPSQTDQIWRLNQLRKGSCEHLDGERGIVADHDATRLYLDRAAFCFNLRPCRSFRATYRNQTARRPKTEIWAGVACRKYEVELKRNDNRTWTLAQRPYAPCFPIPYTH